MVERYEAKISVRTPQPLVIGLAVGLAFPSAPTWGAGDAERGQPLRLGVARGSLNRPYLSSSCTIS